MASGRVPVTTPARPDGRPCPAARLDADALAFLDALIDLPRDQSGNGC